MLATGTVVSFSNGFLNEIIVFGLCFIMAFKDKMVEHGDSQNHGLCHTCIQPELSQFLSVFTVSKDIAPPKILSFF